MHVIRHDDGRIDVDIVVVRNRSKRLGHDEPNAC